MKIVGSDFLYGMSLVRTRKKATDHSFVFLEFLVSYLTFSDLGRIQKMREKGGALPNLCFLRGRILQTLFAHINREF